MENLRKYHPSVQIYMLGVLTIVSHLALEKSHVGKEAKLITKEVVTEQSSMFVILAALTFVWTGYLAELQLKKKNRSINKFKQCVEGKCIYYCEFPPLH